MVFQRRDLRSFRSRYPECLALEPREVRTMEGLNTLEQAVLDKLLAGNNPILAVLREQAMRARVAQRELTGVGFFVTFEVPTEAPIVEGSRDCEISDVDAVIEGLARGA